MFKMKISTILLLAAGAAGFSALPPEMQHPVITPPLDWGGAMEQDLLAALPSQQSKIEPWPAGIIPTSCHMTPWNDTHFFESADIAAYSVTYEDCFAPWLICRHKDSQDPIERVVEYFGRLPIGLRENVKTLTIVPSRPNGILAWEIGDVVVFQGGISLGVLSHEITHSLDSDQSGTNGGYLSEQMLLASPPSTTDGTTVTEVQLDNAPFTNTTTNGKAANRMQTHEHLQSSAAAWTSAVKLDTAAVSQYSLANCVEHFAEVGRAAIYDIIVGAMQAQIPYAPPPAPQLGLGLFRVNVNASQVIRSVRAWQGIFGDVVKKTGSCTARKEMPVPMAQDPAVAGKWEDDGVLVEGVRLRPFPATHMAMRRRSGSSCGCEQKRRQLSQSRRVRRTFRG